MSHTVSISQWAKGKGTTPPMPHGTEGARNSGKDEGVLISETTL